MASSENRLRGRFPHAAPQRGRPSLTNDEVRALVTDRGGQLHLLTGRTGEGNPPFGPDSLRALVPDLTERDVYVWGPPAMTSAVLGALRTLRVPQRQVHAERCGLD